MMFKRWCKRCFLAVVDDTASDKQLLMTAEKSKCPSCGNFDYIVSYYFKYGEHCVTDDGKRIAKGSKHLGLNPNYSYWGADSAYGA
jgi:hypothetical protein